MRSILKSKITTIFTLISVLSISATVQAQSTFSRCNSPSCRQGRPFVPNSPSNAVTRYRPGSHQIEDAPPVFLPYYSNEGDDSQKQDEQSTERSDGVKLVPTESLPSKDRSKIQNRAKPADNKPSVAELINRRYSDPRITRMLAQLSPSTIESMYAEVSELIDGRHINPSVYSRRIDNALDHLVQALDVPSFIEAAGVRGYSEEIASLKDDLQEMRNALWVKNVNDAVAALRKVQLMVAQSVEMNPAAVGMEFLYGATDSLDMFSMLLPPEKNGGPSVGLRDNVVGIGVEVEPHESGLKIMKLLPGGPAAKADLRRGDVITRVDGNDLKQMDLNRAVDYIVGPVGTPVEIQASRDGRSGRVTLTRQRIPLHSVTDIRMEDRSRGIAYLKLEQFAESTTNELDSALMNLHQQGMKSLIIDLRGNPGGLLTTAIAVSDRFLPTGTIVSTRGRTREDNSNELAQFEKTWKMPLVVLVDRNSASASEIFAAAIQDNGRGLIVGEKSYGKGTVQTLFPLQSFPAGLRLTTAKFYSPNGREIAGAGVTPDVKVANDPSEAKQGDAVLSEAKRQIVEPRIKEMANTYRRTGQTIVDTHVAA